jgi:hypothetical protein
MTGTMKQPKLEAEATFENLGPDSVLENESLLLSGKASGEYDGKSLVWKVQALSARGAKVNSTGELLAPWNARTLRPTLSKLSTNLVVKSFPLQSIQSFAAQRVRGTVDLRVSVDDWGTAQEKVNAEMGLLNIDVAGLAPAQGQLRAHLEQGQAQGSLELSGSDYSLSGTGELAVLREGMWGVKLGETRRGNIDAKGIPLALLQSIVGPQVAGISGTADLQLEAQSTPAGATIAAEVEFKDGAFQIPSLGQQLRDIDLKARWNNDEIVVDTASFRGSAGRRCCAAARSSTRRSGAAATTCG